MVEAMSMSFESTISYPSARAEVVLVMRCHTRAPAPAPPAAAESKIASNIAFMVDTRTLSVKPATLRSLPNSANSTGFFNVAAPSSRWVCVHLLMNVSFSLSEDERILHPNFFVAIGVAVDTCEIDLWSLVVADEVHSVLRSVASRVAALLHAVEPLEPRCEHVLPVHTLHMLRHAWKVLPEVSLPQRGSFISSHAKIAGSSRFVEDARRELQGIVVVAVSKGPGAHHCHAHSGGFLEHLCHGRPGRLVCSSVHQPVNVGAVHVERLPSQAVASSRNRAEMTK